MNKPRTKKPNGFIALAVLAAVAIVLVLYMITIKGILPAGNSAGGSNVKIDRPWLLEGLILPACEIIDMPNPPKIVIDEDFQIKAKVSRNESDRGIAVLEFDDNGEVSGKWECDYTHQERQYSYISTYAGNIVDDKRFKDATGTDKTLLFFITKGNYTQRVYHRDMGEKLTEGIIYLSGWIGPDKSLKGKLTITMDNIENKDKWSASYNLMSE